MADDQDDSQWHLDKKVPLAIIGAMFIQTFLVGAWAATLSFRVSDLEKNGPQVVAEFTKLEEARERTNLSINSLTSSVDALSELIKDRTSRFDQIQQSLGRIERKTHPEDSTPPR